jgi:hypothetical protein
MMEAETDVFQAISQEVSLVDATLINRREIPCVEKLLQVEVAEKEREPRYTFLGSG